MIIVFGFQVGRSFGSTTWKTQYILDLLLKKILLYGI